jgi:hypothetical protein
MTLGYLIDCERAEEREEVTKEVTKATRIVDIIELLEDVGTVSEEIKKRLESETEEYRFKYLHKLAAKVSSIEEFEEKYDSQAE